MSGLEDKWTSHRHLQVLMGVAVFLGMLAGFVGANAQPGGAALWTVRPEWVRAHEEFLSSDVMNGRGSATRDEHITATYVASEFVAYGLKPAPGMKDYIQSAEIASIGLNGHAKLSAGALEVEEGKGLRLLVSSGESVHGPLLITQASVPKTITSGSVLLVTGTLDVKALGNLFRAARRAHAGAVLFAEGAAAQAITAQWGGGGTHVPFGLVGVPLQRGLTMMALSADVLAELAGQTPNTPISIEVSAVTSNQTRFTYNAIGYLPGTDPASGTLLLTAHLDHLGIGRPVNGDSIYNGANDDASGTTAVLELAHALAAGPRLRRSILFVCYGSEEAGELGSSYFGKHSPVPLKELIANLEFEMIGNQDPKMARDTLLLTGWDRSNLGPALRAHGAKLGADPYPEQRYFERSDNYQLALEGVVAHTAAGWGTTPTYHQPDDDMAHLDLDFMTIAIQSLIEPIRWLAESDFRPVWNKDGAPKRQDGQ